MFGLNVKLYVLDKSNTVNKLMLRARSEPHKNLNCRVSLTVNMVKIFADQSHNA